MLNTKSVEKMFYEDGISMSDIGKKFGVSRQRIFQVLKKYKTMDKKTRELMIGKQCDICDKKTGLNIHHIDKNSQNNKKSNLKTLCKSCHRAEHLEPSDPLEDRRMKIPKELRKKIYSISRKFGLSKRDSCIKIVELSKIGYEYSENRY